MICYQFVTLPTQMTPKKTTELEEGGTGRKEERPQKKTSWDDWRRILETSFKFKDPFIRKVTKADNSRTAPQKFLIRAAIQRTVALQGIGRRFDPCPANQKN